MKKVACLIAVFVLIGSLSPVLGGSKNDSQWKWKTDDLITPDRIASPVLAPDGKQLVWTVRKWDLKEHKTYNVLYLTRLDVKKGQKPKRIQLSRGQDSFSSIQWVPGENKISFKTSRKFKDTKPGNVWVLNLEGGDPYPVTSFENGLMQYQWLDKENLLFIAREEKNLYEQKSKEAKDTSEVVEDEDHRVITRLFKYNLKSKKTERLTQNVKPITRFQLSYNRKWATYSVSMSLLYGQDNKIRPKFYLIDLTSAESKEIFSDPALRPGGYFVWARDNSGFYAGIEYSTHPVYLMASITKIYWYPLSTGKYKEVDLQWDRYGSRLFTTSDGFVIALLNGVHYKYARFVKKSDFWKRSWINGDIQKNISSVQLAENGKTMLYSYSTASVPNRYYTAELKGNNFVKKFEVMDIGSIYFKKPLAKSEILTWKGAKDEEVEGILYYPVTYEKGKKYPLVLMIHGGPYGADMDFFSAGITRPMHMYAERGAFVLRVNYHGSSNYGLAFGESIAGHYYEYEVPDIEKGVDMLIAKGLVDEDKLGFMGWSNGAILGTGVILQTERYKAASLGAGDVNWTSDYGNCAFGVSFDNYYFGGPPWEKLDHYIEKSPLFQIHKITTPVLIFHGTKDRAVPYSQGWEYYRALQQIGKAPVRFISFPGEGHGPRKLSHMRRKVTEDMRWFEKYLFKTYKEKNESLKKDSPLDKLDTLLKIARVNGRYGIKKNSVLVPETVTYKEKTVGRFEVTRAQWAAFDKDFKYDKGTCNYPVTAITFEQAQKYVQWLSEKTGESYRLPKKNETKTLYDSRSGNTFDYWAGYTLSPDDYKNLQKELGKYKGKPVLLKPAGSFKASGKDPVFDLGGNAAEWVEIEAGKGKACGGSAERPKDKKTSINPKPAYTGLRVVKEKKEKT